MRKCARTHILILLIGLKIDVCHCSWQMNQPQVLASCKGAVRRPVMFIRSFLRLTAH